MAARAGVYVELADLVRLQHQAYGFSLLPRQPARSLLAGTHASRLRGRGLDFDEIRDYQTGDDIRYIDWNVTARTRKPHTRVFTEERERPLLLVVDQRVTMFFGSRVKMKSVAAAEASALAAWRSLRLKDRVGAIVFDDRDLDEIRPRRSRAAILSLLQAIVARNQALGADGSLRANPAMFNEALRRAQRTAVHDHVVCLVTDASGADAATRELVSTIARHNDVMIIFIQDPLEVELPALGEAVLSDGSRELQLDLSAGDLALRYRTEFAERLKQVRQFLLHRRIPVLPIDTVSDVAKQIVHLLGAGPRPGEAP